MKEAQEDADKITQELASKNHARENAGEKKNLPKAPPKEAPNDICKNCLKWAQFGEDCRVFWVGKKFCTMRVGTMEEWEGEQHLLKR